MENQKLYKEIVKEAKEKFLVWPSAYASGWIVNTYKKRGGTYKYSKNESSSLKRWYKEKWINVCEYIKNNKYVKCGRKKAEWSNYPYCRPKIRINEKTPMTLNQLIEKEGINELKKRCKEKNKNPLEKINKK